MATVAFILVAAGLALTTAACGSSPAASPPASAPTNAALAFARCMRSNGVPGFPDPDAQGNFPAFHTGVPKQVSEAANDACKHLLPSGGTGTPAQRQQKLEFGVKVAECLRAHGFPDMPDPTGTGSSALPSDIDPSSPQFERAETSCEHHAPKALGLP